MQVVLAKSAGFCYGVSRALETVLEAAKNHGKPMFTLGPLIHNPQVIRKLEADGVRSVKDIGEIPEGSIVVMPSHGVSRDVMERARASGLDIIDVTCPFVDKVHRLADKLVREGYQVVILGDMGHTEVQGILSMAGEDAVVVPDASELTDQKFKRRVGMVAQTTQTIERYRALASALAGRAYEVRTFNTICNATTDRQKAALSVAGDVDAMVIVGGRNSANTRRLADICSETGVPTHHVEVAEEIDPQWFAGVKRVGVSAGASTPDWIVKEVVEKLEGLS